MKTSCELCELALSADSEAYICSYGCTFCPACAASTRSVCPNCGGELLRRPRRITVTRLAGDGEPDGSGDRRWLIWAVSFGVWSFVTQAATLTIYKLYISL